MDYVYIRVWKEGVYNGIGEMAFRSIEELTKFYEHQHWTISTDGEYAFGVDKDAFIGRRETYSTVKMRVYTPKEGE